MIGFIKAGRKTANDFIFVLNFLCEVESVGVCLTVLH